MTLGWYPTPLALALSTTFRGLSLEEQGALRSLYDATSGHANVHHHDAYSNHERAQRLWGDRGPTILDELFASGLVEDVEEGLWRLTIVAHLRAEEHTARSPQEPVEGRAPSLREAGNRLRARWSKAKVTTADDRLAWIASAAGQKALADLGLPVAEAEELARATGRKGGRYGLERLAPNAAPTATVGDANHGANWLASQLPTLPTGLPTMAPTAVSPSLSPSERERLEAKRDTLSDAGASMVPTTAPTTAPTGWQNVVPTNRQPSAQIDADLVRDVLTRESGGRFEANAPAQQLVAFVVILRELGVTPDLLAEMGRLCRSPEKVWKWWAENKGNGARVMIPTLLGTRQPDGSYEAVSLQALVSAARESLTRKPIARPPTATVQRIPSHAHVTPEQAASLWPNRIPKPAPPTPSEAPQEPPHATR